MARFDPSRAASMHHLMFLAICLMWGSSFILMKKAAESFGPLTIAGGRVLGGALLLIGLWLTICRGKPWPLRWRDAPGIAFIVCVGLAYPFAMQPHLIDRYQDSAFFGMMPALVPLLTILASIPLLGVHPTGRQLVGVIGGLICLTLLFDVGIERAMSAGDILLGLSVPVCYALSNTFAKRRFSEVHPIALTGTALGSTALIMVTAGLAAEPIEGSTERLGLSLLALAVLGVVCTGLAWYMFFILLQKRGPLFAGMVTYLVPIGALAWGWADGEPIALLQVIALAGVFLMTGLVQTAKPGKSAPPQPAPPIRDGETNGR